MSSNQIEFEKWDDVLDHKARILYAQIAQMQREIGEQGGDEQLIDTLCEPYYDLLKSMYAEDYPLAKAVENSDLLITLEGPAISRENPRISIISGVFRNVRSQVTKIAKAIAHLSEIRGTPQEVDLGLSAFAKGSLVLGFTLPSASDVTAAQQKDYPLLAPLAADQPLFQAAREAIRTLGMVTQHITENRPLAELSEIISDAKVRDSALIAVKELAPTLRSGIQTVRIGGRQIAAFKMSRPLTPATREVISQQLEHPVTSKASASPLASPPVSFVGIVREIDLDDHRFDLRHIENMEVNDMRCSYLDATDEEATEWLNKSVRVTGVVERDRTGKAQMLEITAPVEILS